LLDESDQPELIPSIRLLHAYFPGHSSALDLKIERAEENAETVLCSIEGGTVPAPGLQLSKDPVQAGEALVSIGYPGGIPLLASRLPDDLKRELFKFGTNNSDELAGWLAAHGLIQPIVMQARVSAQAEGKVFYEMVNALGSTGGPLLNAEGKVAAMSHSVNVDYPAVNLAVPVASFKSWLDQVSRVIQ